MMRITLSKIVNLSLLLLCIAKSADGIRRDKECGEVNLRTDAGKQNRTSGLVKIGGFEWALVVEHTYHSFDYLDWISSSSILEGVLQHDHQSALDTAATHASDVQRVHFNANRTNMSHNFDDVHSWHERYVSAVICVLNEEPKPINLSLPSRDRNFRLTVRNETFFINFGYVAAYAHMLHYYADHGSVYFRDSSFNITEIYDVLNPREIEEYLQVLHPNGTLISAKNVETLIKVSVHLGVVHTEVVQACENFLWETDEIPLAKRLQIADWYLLTDLFRRLLPLIRSKEDVPEIAKLNFNRAAREMIYATVGKLTFSVKWEHVFG